MSIALASTRRRFIGGTAATAGALVVGFHIPRKGMAQTPLPGEFVEPGRPLTLQLQRHPPGSRGGR